MGINVGIVGVGEFANVWIKIWKSHPGVEHLVLCDLKADLLARRAKEHGISDTSPSLEDILKRSDRIRKARRRADGGPRFRLRAGGSDTERLTGGTDMKIVYAFRRTVFYPHMGNGLDLPSREMRGAFLKKVKEMGFDGLEMGVPNAPEQEVREVRRELEDAGLPCLALRGGGPVLHPRSVSRNQERMSAALRAASWIGAEVVNASIGMPRPSTVKSRISWGESTSWGSSRDASEEDFERAAAALAAAAPPAEELRVKISIEIHQHCLADNSWSGLHLIELVNHPNVGLNPDLGNIYWAYDVPEESCEQAIVAMAPRAVYWHMKNLLRIYVPQHEHAIFMQVPLPDGDIDYRFAISAMLTAGYRGAFAIEGLRLGDQIRGDGRSAAYVRELIEEISR